ncbi:BPSL0067 family protein [Massilia aerilata]|uniref:BPSL0067 family protein n=1 Tax=Massilia aerilata TaxID=453817 RepID=A0ABW0RY28_9BURK
MSGKWRDQDSARVIYSKGKSVNGRYIHPSNNADAFFVIEK